MNTINILDKLNSYKGSERIAITDGISSLTYEELWSKSEILAKYIATVIESKKEPVLVYGHKNPMMIVSFVACMKAGIAYVPIDIGLPDQRIQQIVNDVNPSVIILTEENSIFDEYDSKVILSNEFFESKVKTECNIALDYVDSEDTCYIIFTSGSTGKAKGVEVSYGALNNFVKWAVNIGGVNKSEKIILNQAPFSFDLSVMDLYISLYSQSTLWCIDKETQMNYKKLFESLEKSNVNIWVSTPSFAEMCMADKSFNHELLSNLKQFIFCGEVLSDSTVEKLMVRFPNAVITNTYGPTESTVAVTEINITREILDKFNPLPVGYVRQGSEIEIDDEEIVIIGDTVAKGYFRDKEKTESVFFSKKGKRRYKTGDRGYFIDNLLFCNGRIDWQIKLHGYRMEIEDIENNIKKLPIIKQCAVVPIYADAKVKFLKAYCVVNTEYESKSKLKKEIKAALKELIPDYMIPAKWEFIDNMPMNVNGKIDRKGLQDR